jgi:hypothetical protein
MDNIYYHKYLKYKKKYLELQRGGVNDSPPPEISPNDIPLLHGISLNDVDADYNKLFNNEDKQTNANEPEGQAYNSELLRNATTKKNCLLNFNKQYRKKNRRLTINIEYGAKNLNTFWLDIFKNLQIVPTDKINNVDDDTKNTTYHALIGALTLAKTVTFDMFTIKSTLQNIFIKVDEKNTPTCEALIRLRDSLIGYRNTYIKNIKSFIGTLYEYPIDILFCFTTWVDNLSKQLNCTDTTYDPDLSNLD